MLKMTNAQCKALLDNWDQVAMAVRNALVAQFSTGTTVSPVSTTIATRELTAPASTLSSVTLAFSDTLGAGSTHGITLELDCA